MGTIIIDTNVILAAFGWNGTPTKAFEEALSHEIIIPSQQFDEIKRVLKSPRFAFFQEKEQLLKQLQEHTIITVPGTLRLVRHDVDNALLEAAAITAADYIITGDNELLALGHYHHTEIVTPDEFLNR